MTQPNTTPERVLITGGGAGIGAAIAERCRAEGYLPIVIDRVVDSVPGAIRADLSDAADTARALQEALADVISFGVAPAALAYACGMQGGWDWLVLSYFVCCGVSRLARYNVTAEQLSAGQDKVKYFEGTPIPTSLVLVVVLAIAALTGNIGTELWGGYWQLGPWRLHPLVLMFALSGTLMVSKTLRIPKP